jgi:hypothetical protein
MDGGLKITSGFDPAMATASGAGSFFALGGGIFIMKI